MIEKRKFGMFTFILWVLLAIFSLPLAIAVLIIYPFVWLLLLPFRLIGIAVEIVFDVLKSIIQLPFRLLKLI